MIWQDLSTYTQDLLLFLALLMPTGLIGIFVIRRYQPYEIIKALLFRYKKINILIVIILGISLGIGISLISQERALKAATAEAANKFDLIVTAPGSQIDMMLATVYLQPTDAPLLDGKVMEAIANDPKVDFAIPIAYGDSYIGFPIVGSTNTFVEYLSDNLSKGNFFVNYKEAIVGAGVPLEIGDTFIPQHGHHGHAEHDEHHEHAEHDEHHEHAEHDEHHEHAEHDEHHEHAEHDEHHEHGEHHEDHDHAKHHEEHDHTEHIHNDKSNVNEDDCKTCTLGHHIMVEIKVVGKMQVTNSPWDKAIITPIESVWMIHGLGNGHSENEKNKLGAPFNIENFPGTPAILVHAKKTGYYYSLASKYSTKESMAFFPGTVLSKLHTLLNDIRVVMSIITTLSLLLVALGVLTTLTLLGKLFSKRFALLRAIGAPKRFIFAIMWGYITVLTTISSLLGIIFGYISISIISKILSSKMSILIQATIGWQELHLVAIFFTTVILLGLIPSYLVFHQPVLSNLREN